MWTTSTILYLFVCEQKCNSLYKCNMLLTKFEIPQVVIQYWQKEFDILLLVTLEHLLWIDILFCSNLGQLSKPGTVLDSACPEDS